MKSQIRRAIPGIDKKYLATDGGQVVRVAGSYETTYRGKRVVRQLEEKVLGGQSVSTKGYARVNIDGRFHMLHRLVALAFVPNPKGLPQVNHKNGVKSDNRPCNLEWVSNLENRRHAVHSGLQARGSSVSQRLTESDVKKIRALHAEGVSQRAIAAAFGVVQQTVSHIVRRSTWTHI